MELREAIARAVYEGVGDPNFAEMPDALEVADKILAMSALQGWQPIETAPRDSSPLLLYDPHNERKPVYEAWWALEYEGGPGFWMTPIGPNGRGYTILDGRPNSPTHWMPLPAPPAD